jgi:hypothetical protein
MPFETASRLYRVPPGAICYLRYTVESYDGIAVLSTEDSKLGIIRIRVAPKCEDILDSLIAHLAVDEGISIKEIDEADVPEISL